MAQIDWSAAADARAFAKRVAEEGALRGEKRPLFRDLPPPTVFPDTALGPLRNAAIAIQRLSQAPMAIVAQSLLAATALAVQAHWDVVLPGSGRKPLTFIFISIAESGERKTTVDKIALRPVHQVEEEQRRKYQESLQSHVNAKEAWTEARKEAVKTNKKDQSAMKSALDAVGPPPAISQPPMILLSDPTPEALTMHLEGRPTVGVFTSEGGVLIGGSAFNDDTKVRMAALLNLLWDGETIRRRRVTTGTAFLPGKRCSAHVMLQPVLAEKLLGEDLFDGMGLLARMLVAFPATTAGTRQFSDTQIQPDFSITEYDLKIRVLLERTPRTKDGEPDALDPVPLPLSPEAKQAWINFYNRCETDLAPGRPLEPIRPFASKLAEHAGRLAGLLTCFNDPDAVCVGIDQMKNGIDLAIYYANEMLRLNGARSISPELKLAEMLLIWWRKQPDPVQHLAAIYQRGPNSIRTAETARSTVRYLEKHGLVEKLPTKSVVDGAERTEAWRLAQ